MVRVYTLNSAPAKRGEAHKKRLVELSKSFKGLLKVKFPRQQFSIELLPGKIVLSRKPTPKPKLYYIRSLHSDKVLDLPLGEPLFDELGDKVPIQQYQKHQRAQDNQIWRIIDRSDGKCYIQNKHSMKVLDIPGGRKDLGTGLQVYTWHGNENQRWTVKVLTTTKRGTKIVSITNAASGLVLDVPKDHKGNKVRIQQYSWNDGDNQKWELIPVP